GERKRQARAIRLPAAKLPLLCAASLLLSSCLTDVPSRLLSRHQSGVAQSEPMSSRYHATRDWLQIGYFVSSRGDDGNSVVRMWLSPFSQHSWNFGASLPYGDSSQCVADLAYIPRARRQHFDEDLL